jgi:hypothetical protein
MDEPIILKFGKGAPKWRKIGKGFNLEGVCKNKGCKAYNKKVWIVKGYGKFNMNMEVYESKCPICKFICEDVVNMGLFQALCSSKGKVKGEEKVR